VACPSAEELAALYDCVLPREQAVRLRAHLAACPRCAADIRVLTSLLGCPEPAEGLSAAQLQRAKQLAVRPADLQTAERRPAGSEPSAARPVAKPISNGK